MDNEILKKYAGLITKTGANVQQDQIVVLAAPIECAAFARMVAEAAYQAGAREVVMNWLDEMSTKIRYLQAADAVFDEFPAWQKEFYTAYAKQGAAFIQIVATDPELMKDVNPDRIARSLRVKSKALEEYRDRLMSDKNAWCLVSMPTAAWARKVFPDLAEGAAVGKLGEAIATCVRLDRVDPAAAWQEHQQQLLRLKTALAAAGLRRLQFTNSLGTDLLVELPARHLWHGGAANTPEGLTFFPNMPTEELFTLPLRTGVNGTVYSALPLNYNGNLIEGFRFTFEHGRVVDFAAEKGYETLRHMLAMDEGARFLGEVALVSADSPVAKAGVLFYNTLFDENASCHLALGKAYTPCLEGHEAMTKDQLLQAGANDSAIHVDFMIGTSDLAVTGLTADGRQVSIMRDGRFVL